MDFKCHVCRISNIFLKFTARTIFYYNTYELEKWDVPAEENCDICGIRKTEKDSGNI